MAHETFDLMQRYLLLEPEGEAVSLPGGQEFWMQLMSGEPSDPGIRRLAASPRGRLLSALSMNADWTNWEMHPAGDEVLCMIEGSATFLLELAGGVQSITLSAGRVLVIPSGVWHTAKVSEPARLLAITMGQGTQHRSAQ